MSWTVCRIFAVVGLLTILAGCGPRTLDISNLEDLRQSIRVLREKMELEEQERFDEALHYLVGDAASLPEDSDPTHPSLVLDLYRPLEGLNAEGIVAEAYLRRLEEVSSAVADLEAREVESEPARETLAKFHLTGARVYSVHRNFLEWPVIEIIAENATNKMVSLIHFRATILKEDQVDPWLTEEFDHLVLHGFEPGLSDLWRMEPEQQDWIQLINPDPDMEFILEVMSLEMLGGGVVAFADYGAIEAHRLALYRRTLEEIENTGTLVLNRPPFPPHMANAAEPETDEEVEDSESS